MSLLGAVMMFAQLSLQEAQRDALAASPEVAVARGKLQEAQALYDQARATYGPALMANYAQSPQAGATNNVVTQRLTTVGAQWTLGDLFSYSPSVAQAQAALRAARLDLNDVERTEEVSATSAYYAALSARAARGARDEELSSADAELRAARLRYSAGDAPRLDVIRASVAVALAESDRARARADEENAVAALALETGLDAAHLLPTVETSPPVEPPVDDADAAVRQALARRPDVAAAQENVAAEAHAVEVARRGGWPLVTLSGGYTQGVDTGIPVSGASAAVDLTLPVTGAAHDRVMAEEARLAQARAQLERVRRTVALEVGAAVRSYGAQTVALAAAQGALQQARAEFTAAQIGYRNGAVSSLDVEAARTAYVAALVAEISATYEQAKARATLDLMTGMSGE